jgi:hypothetical protein
MVTIVGTIVERWLERQQFGASQVREETSDIDSILQTHSIQLKLKDPRSNSKLGYDLV